MLEPLPNPPARRPVVALLILLGLLLALAFVVAWMSLTLKEAKRLIEPYILPDAGSTTGVLTPKARP
jgi:hypothetical protein